MVPAMLIIPQTWLVLSHPNIVSYLSILHRMRSPRGGAVFGDLFVSTAKGRGAK